MTNGRFLACAGAALTAIVLSSATASAQSVAPTIAPRVGHIGMPLYLRIPVGSRAEPAALKADQDAMLASQQPVMKRAGKKKR